VRERLESAVVERRAALRSVGTRLPRLAPVLLRAAGERDPSADIRAEARQLLARPTP
jgi:hypothetical protein